MFNKPTSADLVSTRLWVNRVGSLFSLCLGSLLKYYNRLKIQWGKYSRYNLLQQGTLTEGEGLAQLTSSLR